MIDCQMPGVDGFELIDRLASEGEPAPVILMTGNCGPSIRSRAHTTGAVAVLDTNATDDVTGPPTLLTEEVVDPLNGSSTYLTDLCEFNYIRSVLNGSHDFVGFLAGGNTYQYRKSAPLFIVDLYGNVRRLPTSFSDNDVINGEVALKPVVNCLDSGP